MRCITHAIIAKIHCVLLHIIFNLVSKLRFPNNCYNKASTRTRYKLTYEHRKEEEIELLINQKHI